jgi:glycosyltransferase involved in cell wall biosynthesis
MVVTCFNDGETLPETIGSIRREPMPIELVIVDDGSTDAMTREVLDELQASGERIICQSNRGQAAAAMTGVHATNATYVMRFDADDLLEPGAVPVLADALDHAPEAVAAWGDVQTFGQTTFGIPGMPTLDPWLITYTNCTTGSGTLYRRTALLEVGGWRLREGFEDWDVWMSFAERGYRGVYVPRVIFWYRRDSGGRLAGWLDETERHYQVLRRLHEDLFGRRPALRRESAAPVLLKAAAMISEVIPLLPRLARIHLCELVARATMCGASPTARMLMQALSIRIRRFTAR